MKTLRDTALLGAALAAPPVLPAFPGAQGFGAIATGGRGDQQGDAPSTSSAPAHLVLIAPAV